MNNERCLIFKWYSLIRILMYTIAYITSHPFYSSVCISLSRYYLCTAVCTHYIEWPLNPHPTTPPPPVDFFMQLLLRNVAIVWLIFLRIISMIHYCLGSTLQFHSHIVYTRKHQGYCYSFHGNKIPLHCCWQLEGKMFRHLPTVVKSR